MLKSYRWEGWVAHVIFMSAQGPNPSFFLFIRLLYDLGACWDQDLDQDLTKISSVLTLLEDQIFFLQKCTNIDLVSLKIC